MRVKLRSGRVIIAKFQERRVPYIFLEGYKLHLADVVSFTIYKGNRRPND